MYAFHQKFWKFLLNIKWLDQHILISHVTTQNHYEAKIYSIEEFRIPESGWQICLKQHKNQDKTKSTESIASFWHGNMSSFHWTLGSLGWKSMIISENPWKLAEIHE